MRALVQRVTSAQVTVDGKIVGEIGPGILTFLGISRSDSVVQVEKIIQKILKLRIFEDSQGKLNLSLQDTRGSHLIVSQFTLYGDCTQGNRPSFMEAAPPDHALPLYEKAVELSAQSGVPTQRGQFQADMGVNLVNSGPVTLMIEID